MSELLVAQPGKLAAVSNVGVPSYVKINLVGSLGSAIPGGKFVPVPFITSAALITSVQGDFQTNTAFKHALDKRVYVYTFGDRMGQVVVSGLAFDSRCGTPIPTNPITGASLLTGLDEVVLWYRASRASLFNAPVYIVIGLSMVLRGYLVGMNFGTQSPELRSYAWSMRIAALPGMSLGFGRF